uniref:Uncharacterized protein n=1 Tax=Candidatus Kentrum sp. LPFa TaxID=2126335 RepID=A0A450W1T7_9GAMM|nr:MAG: hypothetical protein BECKLPF1236A_GA0070988_100485 [Candidatus Kentron sp. LPFa]VFK27388.1 MAG: hypothetical protein BECKLPF1236C_GA0070990_100465 [Candidatus Kentron sp. LPFa]
MPGFHVGVRFAHPNLPSPQPTLTPTYPCTNLPLLEVAKSLEDIRQWSFMVSTQPVTMQARRPRYAFRKNDAGNGIKKASNSVIEISIMRFPASDEAIKTRKPAFKA